MEKINSKINGKLLHFVKRKSDIKNERENLVSDSEFIQCSSMNLPKGKTFKPHKHFHRKVTNENYIPQESWIVIEGSVKCFFYDIDDKLIETIVLYSGDASFTLEGGHTYEILEDNTIVYEYKTGPYFGIEFDKIMI
jgi:cupin fold WbuC family metalloprotein